MRAVQLLEDNARKLLLMKAEIHVIPIDDQIEHRADCECCTAYPDGYGLWIHHSADKREQYERNGDLGKGWIVAKKDEQTGQLIPIDKTIC